MCSRDRLAPHKWTLTGNSPVLQHGEAALQRSRNEAHLLWVAFRPGPPSAKAQNNRTRISRDAKASLPPHKCGGYFPQIARHSAVKRPPVAGSATCCARRRTLAHLSIHLAVSSRARQRSDQDRAWTRRRACSPWRGISLPFALRSAQRRGIPLCVSGPRARAGRVRAVRPLRAE